jgi:syntaxin 8
LKRTGNSPNPSKSVRFHDSPTTNAPVNDEAANRAALFPYRDDPDGPPEQNHLDNQQIHEYHKTVLQEQDEQLDRLGASIGRQRELSIQIGDELDDHIQMLDEVEHHMDRYETTLDGARRRLGTIARKAKDNTQLTVILILICVLIILIIILK